MKHIQLNKNLKSANTFGIDCVAREFVEITNKSQLQKCENNADIFILGGGSNLLLPTYLDRQVWWINNNFIRTRYENDHIYVEAAAGVVWHDLVRLCVRMGWGGIENMALIPGQVGAAPVQNIGAYGVELKDVFHRLEAFELTSGEFKKFTKPECQFGYRQSVFKQELAGQYVITSIELKLTTQRHRLETSYWAFQEELRNRGITDPTIQDIFDMVVAIRQSKLPDPKILGNSGSFFKNPVISAEEFDALIAKFPTLKNFPTTDGNYKIPAGYLIEQCGWKGKRIGNTGCYEKQALVIVNYGDAQAEEVVKLVGDIKSSVRDKYNIELEEEVRLIL